MGESDADGAGARSVRPRVLVADSPRTLRHAVVHQATGMVSVQLSRPLAQALLRLRAHAYSSGRSITDVAQDVVDRRLRLGPDGSGTPLIARDKD